MAKTNTNSIIVKKNLFVIILLLLCLSLLCIFLIPEQAIAANADTDFVSQLINKFKQTSTNWESKIKDYALIIFRWFATLEVCWIGIRVSLGRENIGDAVKQFVMFILMAGFFLAVIENYHEWSWNLINGLASIGDQIGAPSAAADAPFQTGLTILGTILDKLSISEPVNSLGFILAGLVVVICFALIAARIVLIKCEAMIAMTAALLLVGFGGSSMTKDYAINVIRYVFSVAFKLFVMQLILGVGITFIQEFNLATAELQDIGVIIGASIVLLALVASLPDTVAGIINGSHVGGGTGLGAATAGVVGGAIGVGAGLIAGGAGAVSAGKTLSAASKLASLGGATGMGKIGHMAKNLMSAGQQAKDRSKSTRSSIMRERLAEATQVKNKDKG